MNIYVYANNSILLRNNIDQLNIVGKETLCKQLGTTIG